MSLTLKRLELIGLKLKVKTSITTTERQAGNSFPGTKVKIIIAYLYDSTALSGK